MRTKLLFLFLICTFILGSFPVLASENELETQTESESETDTSVWMEYQLEIDDEVYAFPMKFERFTGLGWTGGTEGGTLKPWQYERYLFRRDDETCSAYVLNLSDQTLPLDECLIAGIVIEEHDWADLKNVISLPGGLVRGVSTGEDILTAYGEPDELIEGSLYDIYTYREDVNQEVELEVYRKTDSLENIRIENFAESETSFAVISSEEVPSSVLSYTRPESLSESLIDYEIELDGTVYAIPVPVTALLEDGWELNTQESDKEIPAQYYGWVTLEKGDLSFTQTVTNPEEYAVAPEYCWLEILEIGDGKIDTKGALSGGVRIGMTRQRLLTLLEENEIEYEMTENSEETIYTYNLEGFGHGMEVTVREDRVVLIACENSFE